MIDYSQTAKLDHTAPFAGSTHRLAMATLDLKTIFGIKLKQLRESRHFTLAELGRACGLSASYLAEIEAGKKYPKVGKIWQIAEALGCSFDDLVSTRLGHEFSELQAFLTSPGVRDFPFDLFGVPAAELP